MSKLNQYTHTANTWNRLGAYFIDAFCLAILCLPYYYSMVSSALQKGYVEISLSVLLITTLMMLLYKILFLKFYGATPGKLAVGLRICSINNTSGALTWSQAVIRTLAELLTLFISNAVYVSALYNVERRHWADQLAETQVRQAEPRSNPPKPRMVMASLLIVYFIIAGVSSTLSTLSSVQWTGQSVVFTLPK